MERPTYDFLLRLRLQPQSVDLAIKTLELIPDLQAHIMHLIGRQPIFTSSIFNCYGAVLLLLEWYQPFSIDVLVEESLFGFRLRSAFFHAFIALKHLLRVILIVLSASYVG